MAYVAVNKNGKEVITPDYPIRWSFTERQTYNKKTYRYEFPKGSTDNWVCREVVGGEEVFYDIIIPKGTIKKLTGKTLTWEDEPIEI